MSKYVIASLIILGTVCIYSLLTYHKKDNIKEEYVVYRDKLNNNDINNNKFKIQYEVRGLEINKDNKLNIQDVLKYIGLAVNKVEKIITKSNKINYTLKDGRVVKDLYLVITLSNEYIKDEDGNASRDTTGGSNIKLIKHQENNIFPVIATIQLLKSSAIDDIQIKYPNSYNKFYYVILHEILHTLGVGFLWTYPDYDKSIPRNTYERYWVDNMDTNPVYIGPALDKYNGLSATVYYYSQFIGINPGKIKAIPIEDNGNGGSRWYHWEQGSYIDNINDVVSQDNRMIDGVRAPGLDNEVMTAWETDKQPLLSTITIANLEDLGYKVNYNEADIDKIEDLDIIKKENEKILVEIKPEIVEHMNTLQLRMIYFIIICIFLVIQLYVLFSKLLI